MGLIPDDIINQVIARSEITEIIGQYVALKKAGRNFKGLCPFHNEKTPSFVVNPDKQIFHCFGCNAGGNSVAFVMRQEHLSFPEAVRFLADKAGIEVPEEQGFSTNNQLKELRAKIITANELAADFFHQQLMTGTSPAVKAAREYLKKRGINKEIVEQFRLGFSPDGWDGLLEFLKSKNIDEALALQAGLVIAREQKKGCYDRFRNRVMFPIFDIQSRCVAFGGRALNDSDAGAKYINSPETPVYTKGQHMFGLSLTKNTAASEDSIIVTEGYMDMIMPFCHGVGNIAAALGTALTETQVRLIRRYTSNVVMLFDTDEAGKSAMIRSLDTLIDEGMNVRVATLSDGDDPDSFIRQYGLDAFKARIAQAESLFDYKLRWLKTKHDVASIEGQSLISQGMLATIRRYKDEVVKYALTQQLSNILRIPMDVLERQSTGRSVQVDQSSSPQVTKLVTVNANNVQHERMLLTLFLLDPQWAKAGREQLSTDDFQDSTVRPVVSLIWQLSDTNPLWSVNDLLGLVTDVEIQSFIASLLAQTETVMPTAKRIFIECVERVKQKRLKTERQRLTEEIRRAEAVNDQNMLIKLREQFNQLLKS